MRILFAHTFYRIPGGEDRHVEAQVELVSQSHDVRLIRESNVELANSPSTAARMLYSKKKKEQIKAVIDDFGPDLIHIHNTYPSLGPAVHLAARERGVPIVMTVHNMRLRCPNGVMFTEGAICHRCERGFYGNGIIHPCFPTRRQSVAYSSVLWVHRFVLQMERQVAMFVAPSQFMRRRLLDWGIEQDRIRVVRHFVRTGSDFRTSVPADSYGIYAGRLSPEKGLATFLHALRGAGDPPFLVVGEGAIRAALERKAHALRLRRTHFLGSQPPDTTSRLVSEARYVVAPSQGEETAGLSAMEGLAAGRPLLVSDRGALPELAETGAGFVFSPEDAADAATKIRRLTSDDERWHRASAEALKFARTHLTSRRHKIDLESVYRETVTGPWRHPKWD